MTLPFLHSKYTLYKLDFTKLWYYRRMSTANDIRIFKWWGGKYRKFFSMYMVSFMQVHCLNFYKNNIVKVVEVFP